MLPRRYDLSAEVALFFEGHVPATPQQCDAFAISLFGEPVNRVPIQGQFSYTLLVGLEPMVVQFRSPRSQLDPKITSLAKSVHGRLAAKTQPYGGIANDSLFVYVIERLPGVAYITVNFGIEKQMKTVVGLARFFATSWINAQPRPETLLQSNYDKMLEQLSKLMPPYLTPAIVSARAGLNLLFGSDFRCALCHGDLNDMNLLVDEETGDLTGVIDWAEASIQPFGMSLWGLETLLGFSDRDGWHYYSASNSLEDAFWAAFYDEIGSISEEDKKLIDISRRVGILLRYGFVWINGVETPVTEQTGLDSLRRLRAFFQKE
ncbi:hypothetical protein MGYG_02212 [Nannizzia gypsea CBS 118893]|uniref:Aminoglycoside phosphotransferase domain-containing protein n=1 Tax=Arthroderma gypseum (strain ATCC MYA-4604 / CBS 118893) TaxID=535722 RepID=E4UQB7_ARTGP|nr:hypothetical protein MGYG_02212 [Nannizzia gypsea CBS 118893]EFQ99198.1 hypothetical protein MGYG_02212 [Nannizzia gypsea CBS 118893]